MEKGKRVVSFKPNISLIRKLNKREPRKIKRRKKPSLKLMKELGRIILKDQERRASEFIVATKKKKAWV